MNHHPKPDVLKQFANGEIVTPLASMVSAHVGVCEHCHALYQEFLAEQERDFKIGESIISSSELKESFDSLMTQVAHSDLSQTHNSESDKVEISVSGENFILPDTFNFLKDLNIPWKEFGKRNAIAPVVTSVLGNFYLIYIGPGEQVPEHAHSNNEYSFVVSGSYKDGKTTFVDGDFAVFEKDHTHTPTAVSADGCLVVSWVEGRLNFFKGILSPLNSFLWWYLHRA